jgi:putative spermidine/putrescine transport system permease protein
MLSSRQIVQGLGWVAVFVLLAPVLQTFWISFSPDALLSPPVGAWSLRWYRAFLEDGRWTAAAARSIAIALSAAAGSLLTATPVAIRLVKSSDVERRLLMPLLLMPALVPAAALGTGLLPLLHATHLWGSVTSMVLVHTTLGLPIALLIIRTHLTDELATLESAARGLGATNGCVFWRVTLPLIAPGLIAAGISVFVLSLNESLVSLFLATPDNETLPAVVWPQLRFSASPIVAVASAVTSAAGIAGALLVSRILRAQLASPETQAANR